MGWRREARHARHAAKWHSKHDAPSEAAATVSSPPAPASGAAAWPDAVEPGACLCDTAAVERNATAAVALHAAPGSRHYVLYVPTSAPECGAPLVLLAPQSSNTALDALRHTHMRDAAARYGFVVAALEPAARGGDLVVRPSPGATARGHVDDLAYARAVVAHAAARACADGGRVVCAGWSRGGRLCSLLAAQPGVRFAGIFVVGGLRAYPPVTPDAPVAVLSVHGTADAVNPLRGGGHGYWKWQTVAQAARRWAGADACEETCERERLPLGALGLAPADAAAVSQQLHTRCASDASVALLTVRGMGHEWPAWGGAALGSWLLPPAGAEEANATAGGLGWQQRAVWACEPAEPDGPAAEPPSAPPPRSLEARAPAPPPPPALPALPIPPDAIKAVFEHGLWAWAEAETPAARQPRFARGGEAGPMLIYALMAVAALLISRARSWSRGRALRAEAAAGGAFASTAASSAASDGGTGSRCGMCRGMPLAAPAANARHDGAPWS